MILSVLGCFTCFSRPPVDSLYVRDLSDSLTIRLHTVYKNSVISIEDDVNQSKVSFEPVSGVHIGGGFTYKWLGLNVSFRLPGSELSDEGNRTTGFDLRFQSVGRVFGFNVAFSHLEGFGLTYESGEGVGLEEGFRPDLHSTRLSFSGFFNLIPFLPLMHILAIAVIIPPKEIS